MFRSREGQITIEYILILAAVISVAIIFMTIPNALFKQRLNATYDKGASTMQDSTRQLFECEQGQGGVVTCK